MASQKYERLTAQDLQFLVLESPTAPMDIVSVQIYRGGPLMSLDGGIDIDAYRVFIDSILHRMPRYRQKLKWIPVADIPVWVDDTAFSIDYHVRHTALPKPGSEDQLRKLVARVLERSLDRERPLWELWMVEGLAEDRYAVISKVHHCMLDGLEGLDLSHVLMSENANQRVPEAPPYRPVKTPSEVSLLWDEWNRRYAQPIDALRNAGELLRRPRERMGVLEKRLGEVRNSLVSMVRRPTETPLNGELSAHRRLEWLCTPLLPLKEAHRQLGCSLNDVVLGLLAGGIRDLFEQRGFDPEVTDFKLATPVYSGPDSAVDDVSSWVISLPLNESDPRQRIAHIAAQTEQLRKDGQHSVSDVLVDLASWFPAGLLSLFNTSKNACVNSLVTSVPGSKETLYSMGAEMEAMYTHVPLLQGIGLGTALMSYNGTVHWGFNGDYDLVPDLAVVRDGVKSAFEDLCAELGLEPQSIPTPSSDKLLGKKASRQGSKNRPTRKSTAPAKPAKRDTES